MKIRLEQSSRLIKAFIVGSISSSSCQKFATARLTLEIFLGGKVKQLILAIGLLTSGFCFADDPNFSFDAAAKAFATARAPSKSELAMKWMQIGEAHFPGVPDGNPGYYPDGKLTLTGYSGFFQHIASFTDEGKDAFGNELISFSSQWIGFETRKIYSNEGGPFSGRLTATGYVTEVPSDPNGDVYFCGMQEEWRVADLSSGPMFLVSISITDPYRSCAPFRKSPAAYQGFTFAKP